MPTAQAIKCGCGKTLSIPPTFKAAKAKCPGCGAILPVAGAASSTAKPTRMIGGFGVIATIESSLRGEILRARDPQGKPVRLVAPPAAVAKVPEYLARFKAEGLAARPIAHPNLLRVLTVLDTAGTHYLVTEDVEGESLATIFARGEPMDVARASEIFAQILAATAAAHNAKVIHRDLRPEHVWIGADGKARVAGFGLAKPSARDLKGVSQDATDLPHYMAPELIKGEAVTQRVDLYSIGCMFYQALTGRTPYSETLHARLRMMHTATQEPVAVRQVRNDVSVPLSRLVMHLMGKESNQRYMKADVALRDLSAQTGVEAPAVTAPAPMSSASDDGPYEEDEDYEEEPEERSGMPMLAWLGIGVFVVGALVAAYYVVQSLSVPKVPVDPNAAAANGGNPSNPNNPDVVNVNNPPTKGGPAIVIEDPMEVRKRALKRDLERFFGEAEQFADGMGYLPASQHYAMIATRIQDDGLQKEFAADQTRARVLQEICKILQEAAKALDEGLFPEAKGKIDAAKATLLKLNEPDVVKAWTARIYRHEDQLKDAPLAEAQRKLNGIWAADLRVPADEIEGYFTTLSASPDSKYTKDTFASGKSMFESRVKQIRGFIENVQIPEAVNGFKKLRSSFGRAPWVEPEMTKLNEELEQAKKDAPPPENP